MKPAEIAPGVKLRECKCGQDFFWALGPGEKPLKMDVAANPEGEWVTVLRHGVAYAVAYDETKHATVIRRTCHLATCTKPVDSPPKRREKR